MKDTVNQWTDVESN